MLKAGDVRVNGAVGVRRGYILCLAHCVVISVWVITYK